MMRRRNAKNCLDECIGFVKKSAMLSRVDTYGTSSSNFSTMSRTKKWRRSTCFMRSCCSGLYETSRAALLSVYSNVGEGSPTPRPEVSLRKYTSSLAASESAMNHR